MAGGPVAEFTSFDVLEELMQRVQAELEPFVKRVSNRVASRARGVGVARPATPPHG